MNKLLAGEITFPTLRGVGDLGDPSLFSTNVTASLQFTSVMSRIIGLLTAVGALWFIFTLISGAYGWLSSGNDKQGLDNAKKKITNGVVGLFIIVFSYIFIGLIGYLFGIDIIRLGTLIQSINP